LSDGNAWKSKLSRLLTAENLASLIRRSTRPPLSLDQLQFDEPQQVADMIDALGRALTGDLVIFAQERWKLERFQMVSQQDLRRVGHAAPSARRAMYERAEVVATVARGRYG